MVAEESSHGQIYNHLLVVKLNHGVRTTGLRAQIYTRT